MNFNQIRPCQTQSAGKKFTFSIFVLLIFLAKFCNKARAKLSLVQLRVMYLVCKPDQLTVAWCRLPEI